MAAPWEDRFDVNLFELKNSLWLERLIEWLWNISVGISTFLPVVLVWHYWYLASSILLKCLLVVGVVAAIPVFFSCRMIAVALPKLQSIFCVALLPMVIIQTFIMWKVFGFNLLFVALPYGVVAAVLILIKFWINSKKLSGADGKIGQQDIAKYNGIFHFFSLNLVALSIFPVCAIKILRGATQFSKLAKGIFLSITMIGSVIFVCGVAAFSWMLGTGVFMNDNDSDPYEQELVVAIQAEPADRA